MRRPVVDLPTMKAALSWGDYLAAQNAALSTVTRQDPALTIAERILDWIGRQSPEEETFTRRGLTRSLAGGKGRAVQKAADLDAPLAALVEAGWIRPAGRPVTGARGPQAAHTAYAMNPSLRASLAAYRAGEAAERRAAKEARPDAPFTRW